ncbi:MAG: DUF839 domain-containing protein, partial [Bacteroidetes bacterium]|nr:DUF839 domain-containing protein [Bacteroidota bacterium]
MKSLWKDISKHLFWGVLLSIFGYFPLYSQHISNFISLPPGSQDTDFHIPSSHVFQYLIETGDPLTAGGLLPDRCDFAGYVPINGSSTNGYLSVNSERTPGGVTVLDINYNTSLQKWLISASQKINFNSVNGTARNCSGAVTPWGTVISCEENIKADLNGDGFKDIGWAIEIDPVNKIVIDQPDDLVGGDKLWHLGNFQHENAVIHNNLRTVYQGEDDIPGYMYKFVADTAEDLSSGNLYVLNLTSSTSGQWILLNNSTPNECNSTISQAAAAGATTFQGIEDVEISPIDGKIYMAVKDDGKVYRFDDSDPLTGSTVSNFETYVGGMNYTIDYGAGNVSEPWGYGNDNLAFDDFGNLWVQQDGGNNYIWLVEAGHSQTTPKVKIFARTPAGSEPTGIYFTPDHRFMFMSIQHPNSSNNATTILDAFYNPRAFDEDVVLVISLREHLGFPLNVKLIDFW